MRRGANTTVKRTDAGHVRTNHLRGATARRRRSFVYAMVLGVAMCVSVIGLSALMAVRIERRSQRGVSNFAMARAHAQTAIEMGYFLIQDDPDWRTKRTSGVWVTDQPVGEGTFTLEVTDPDDGDLAVEPNNYIVLTGTGVHPDPSLTLGVQDEARFKLQVWFEQISGGFQVLPGTWRQVVD